MNLYFIALLPSEEIRQRIKELKLEIANRYNSRHALKSPAHITLLPPFKTEAQQEPALLQGLKQFAAKQESFQVDFCGFGSFPPRVIFLKVFPEQPIIELQQQLEKEINLPLKLRKPETRPYHPHLTLATRDLDRKDFERAWANFRDLTFQSSFKVKSVFLLKHNGKEWEIFREYGF